MRDWHGKYATAGLTIVGVHSPEFFWEKPTTAVVAATKKLGILYPVVQDDDFAIWNRYAVRAWPTRVLVDRSGVVRFNHIGEGAYEETEALIRRLLDEKG